MSARLKVKIVVLWAIAVVGLVAMGAWVSAMQNDLAQESYAQDIERNAQELPELLSQAADEVEQNTQTFDAIYQSKAASVAFMANNNAGFDASAPSATKMSELESLLEVDNVLIVTRAGDVVAQAEQTKADFTTPKFAGLYEVFDSESSSGEAGASADANSSESTSASESISASASASASASESTSSVVAVDDDAQNWHDRYYACAIDSDLMVVIEQNPDELNQLVSDFGSLASVLKNITVGENGFVFAVSESDDTLLYYPDESCIGSTASSIGLDVSECSATDTTWVDFADGSYFCGVTLIDGIYYIQAIPESDFVSARSITTGVILFVFFAIMAMVVYYGTCVLRDEESRGNAAKDFAPAGPFYINKIIAKKGAILSFVGFIAIVIIAFYMQTLFALSSESVSNTSRAGELANTMQVADERADVLREEYSTRYLDKCQVAAYMLDNNPDLANKQDLERMAQVLQVQYIDVFNEQGEMTATNSSYVNYTLSDDPSDYSYEFRKLLQGVDHVVQDARIDEISGDLRQYIGVALHDASGTSSGFVQINVRPSRLQSLLESVQVERVLDGVKVGSNGFAFAINKQDDTFAYYPESKLIGKSALESGMSASQLKDGFSDYITINGQTYYAASVEQGDYYLYVAGSEGELMSARGPLTLATAIVALICQVLIFLILVLERKSSLYAISTATEESERSFDTTMPTGRTVRTESAVSRTMLSHLAWSERSPEQKVASAIKVVLGVSVLAVFVAVVFKDQIFGKDSLFSYILGGTWERGLNIFAITASLMFACVAITIATIVKRLLMIVAGALDARGETVCRLVGSFIKYATIIGMIYYCLALLGVDTTTLLASAGILSIAVSLGAKELVSDILSGLFIIFEGEFRVGDIITVGSWTGTVVEIGVRTTKVMNAAQNIKVIRNSNVSDIINMTKQSTYTWIDVGIEYSESLERVEAILADELPNIAREIPELIGGPFYKGVVSLGDSSVNIRIMAQCLEKDRGQVERDLNREIKLLFDHYDIGIPFPQIVVNRPLEKRLATEEEREDAERFNREQREATKDLEVEEGV